MGINAKHRKKFKSGACIEYAPLPAMPKYSRKGKAGNTSSTVATAILTRPEYFERDRNPRTMQSIFGRVMSRCLGIFGRAKLAAA